ncbi:MAG TPA: LPS assembly protein LptD [Chthoniobacterales bacterium]|nr:LPS assembly protein LptD [Chthoniobacterales bacterium]
MRMPFRLFLVLIAGIQIAGGATAMPENQPVEITSSGETTYENGLATARDNVAIHVGDTDIYADFAQYNSRTHEITADGDVRIYRDVNLYIAEHAVYNLDTKQVRTGKMRTEYNPYFLSGQKVVQTSQNAYQVQDANFTTHDSPNPNFHLHARTVRVYENDHVVFHDVTFYVGDVPVFWWPYLYQSLNDAFNFEVSPAYLSSWGPSVLTQLTFPITDDIQGRLRLDYRGRRGVAIGFESDIDYGKDNSSNVKIKTYYLQDQNPLLNQTAQPRTNVPTGRYRLSLEDRTNFTDDIYAIVDVTKLSDPYVMQDFYQNEFRIDPVPDDVVALTKTDPFYTITGIARFQANEFFEQTERLPEVVVDIKRHALFGGPIFYEGESGIADLHRDYAENSGFENYSTIRLDSFHQLIYPNTYFGWLSIVPRAGFRATYYDDTRDLGKSLFGPNTNPLEPSFLPLDPTPKNPVVDAGSGVRTIFDTGVEASFKVTRTWDDVENSALGLDGLMHVIQPFTEFSYVHVNGLNPSAVLQFDRFEPSTQLRPLDFPEFTAIDSIADWTIWRLGLRNRLETRRDDVTVTWLELDTFCEINFESPYDRTQYSNLFNKLRFTPLPWASLTVDSQIPAFDRGFTEVNTMISVQPVANLQISVGNRYLHDNPFFDNSNLFVVGGYCRMNDNWGLGLQEQFEAQTGTLQQQRYAVYRDLTNWVASFGAVVRDNAGVREYGVLLTFTLKAFPKIGFDFNFDPGSEGQ